VARASASDTDMDTDHPTVEIEGRTLRLSNLSKVLYPGTGFTKAQVIEYYIRIAPVLLPHVLDRPLTVRRFPNGVDGESFYEKHRPRGTPEWVRSVKIPGSPKSVDQSGIDFVVLSDVATVAWVANLAALELHVPQWKVDRSTKPLPPDLLVFDLDPGAPSGIIECAEVALLLAEELRNAHGWDGYPKVSGSKGLQVYVPLPKKDRQKTWGDGGSRELARTVANELGRRRPDLVVANMRKDLRKGRVLIDWSQNHVAKTTVAPYSLRARSEPTVSAPITWEEVERLVSDGKAERLRFLPEDVLQRVEELGDLFGPLVT